MRSRINPPGRMTRGDRWGIATFAAFISGSIMAVGAASIGGPAWLGVPAGLLLGPATLWFAILHDSDV